MNMADAYWNVTYAYKNVTEAYMNVTDSYRIVRVVGGQEADLHRISVIMQTGCNGIHWDGGSGCH